jgi:hypothetical protein
MTKTQIHLLELSAGGWEGVLVVRVGKSTRKGAVCAVMASASAEWTLGRQVEKEGWKEKGERAVGGRSSW